MRLLGLILLVVVTVPASLAASGSAPPDSGLLITRVNAQQWQLRLIAGTSAQQFSGVVESSTPFVAVRAVQLESTDSATLTSPTTLSATFASWPGGLDGVDFTVTADARLCLRPSANSSAHLYLGSTLASAVEVSAPVALTSADACLAAPARKYHPGHYIALLRGVDSQAVMAASIEPGVMGLMKRYSWRSLEPTQGVYQFSEIASDLNWAAANGMRLIVMVEDKTFTPEKPTPAYLDAYALRNRSGGYTAIRWSPMVLPRWKALVEALGKQFDSIASFEGFAMQETAPGLTYTVLKANGYTPELYRDAYIDFLTDASKSLPTSRVFWFMNFFPVNESYIASVASAVAPLGVLMGGPDVQPDNPKLESKVYPFYDQFQGKMPLFGQVEGICYEHLHSTSGYQTKFWTMPELFDFALTKLHVNYMFWVRLPKPLQPGSYDWLDALPVIAANPTFNP
jgi:hypothetical protein